MTNSIEPQFDFGFFLRHFGELWKGIGLGIILGWLVMFVPFGDVLCLEYIPVQMFIHCLIIAGFIFCPGGFFVSVDNIVKTVIIHWGIILELLGVEIFIAYLILSIRLSKGIAIELMEARYSGEYLRFMKINIIETLLAFIPILSLLHVLGSTN